MTVVHRPPSTFSRTEFERLARSGGFGRARVELRRGLITKMNPQYVPHAQVKARLAKALENAIDAAGLGWKIFQQVSVDFGEAFQPLPDIVVFDPADVPANLEGPLPASAVKLVVEVADASLADDVSEKLEDHAAAGLAEYWVADAKGRIILRHAKPEGDGFGLKETARFGEAFAPLAYAALHVSGA